MRLLSLGARPTRGQMKIMGRDIGQLRPADIINLRRQTGVVFQDFRLLDHLSAFDNIALPLRAAGKADAHIKKNVDDLLDWIGLNHLAHAKPATLSGGEQQRVAIGRAIINRPRLLLADEPTGNVDQSISHKLLLLFEELNRLGTTVIIATHDQSMIEHFDYPKITLKNGRLTEAPMDLDLDFSYEDSFDGAAPPYEQKGAA